MSGERAVPGWVLGRLRELASERRAVLAPLAGEGWKPFATAPTDREILAWREDSGVLLVEWTTPEDLDPSIMDMSIEEHEEAFGDMDTGEPAWFCLAPEERLEGDELPTHWMPLPEGPDDRLTVEEIREAVGVMRNLRRAWEDECSIDDDEFEERWGPAVLEMDAAYDALQALLEGREKSDA